LFGAHEVVFCSEGIISIKSKWNKFVTFRGTYNEIVNMSFPFEVSLHIRLVLYRTNLVEVQKTSADCTFGILIECSENDTTRHHINYFTTLPLTK
jgi:hypothetical protein